MARSYLPPGFRFHPTDEELLVHYLKRKVAGRKVGEGVIGEIEIYKFEPADLPGLATLQSRDPEWFFFNAQDRKYLHGARTNRTTEAGYWKATGKDRKICTRSCNGLKKTLIYYSGRAPHGKRTDWIMHEYRLDEEFEKKMNCTKSFVLCRIRRKGGLGPRNGEQYGAPVLETNEENEGGLSTSNPLEEACGLPLAEARTPEMQVLEMPHAVTDEGVAVTDKAGAVDDIDVFLQTLISREQQEGQDEVFSLEEVLGLANNLSDIAVMEPAYEGPMDLGFEDLEDNLCDMLHPDNNEPAILEDMLRFVSSEVKVSDGVIGRGALHEYYFDQGLDDVDNAGFIEMADLEEPCDEQGTLECCDIEELIYELEHSVEFPMSASLAQERLQEQSLHSFADRQSPRGLQHLRASGILNEQLAPEVQSDSSQGLSVLDSVYTRLLTSDDGGGFSDDLPSGFVLNSDQEADFTANSVSSVAHSHYHSSRADGSSEDQLLRVDSLSGGVNLDMQGGDHLVASVPQEETKVAHGESLSMNSNTTEQALQQFNSTAGLPNNEIQSKSSVGSSASNPSSPSSFARVLSGFLGRVNVLPASAAELPDSRKYFAAAKKTANPALTYGSSSSTSGSSLHLRVKLIDLVEQTARTPEMELQLSVSHTVGEQVSMKPCRSFTNGLSLFLFTITTIALICFCMFRGFCRSTRTAIL